MEKEEFYQYFLDNYIVSTTLKNYIQDPRYYFSDKDIAVIISHGANSINQMKEDLLVLGGITNDEIVRGMINEKLRLLIQELEAVISPEKNTEFLCNIDESKHFSSFSDALAYMTNHKLEGEKSVTYMVEKIKNGDYSGDNDENIIGYIIYDGKFNPTEICWNKAPADINRAIVTSFFGSFVCFPNIFPQGTRVVDVCTNEMGEVVTSEDEWEEKQRNPKMYNWYDTHITFKNGDLYIEDSPLYLEKVMEKNNL